MGGALSACVLAGGFSYFQVFGINECAPAAESASSVGYASFRLRRFTKANIQTASLHLSVHKILSARFIGKYAPQVNLRGKEIKGGISKCYYVYSLHIKRSKLHSPKHIS